MNECCVYFMIVLMLIIVVIGYLLFSVLVNIVILGLML